MSSSPAFHFPGEGHDKGGLEGCSQGAGALRFGEVAVRLSSKPPSRGGDRPRFGDAAIGKVGLRFRHRSGDAGSGKDGGNDSGNSGVSDKEGRI
jgi:hypothetical protein